MRYHSLPLRLLLITYLLSLISVSLISCGDNANNSSQTSATTVSAPKDNSPYSAGKTVYQKTCIVCHQADGNGTPGIYPPLASSDYLLADKFRAIKQVIKGSAGKLTVNGTEYQGVMTPQSLNDSDVAQVLNYVYHSFGNNGFTVSASEVKSVRDTLK
ncbi:MAG TPA: cytochrome c [Bacteroidia bacterium]|jgi:mono/diheme cytochrome c family protein|nr:cytochrome c [Bacteroidia bacterium]